MRCVALRGLEPDGVLRPILTAHAGDGDPRWRAVLVALLWQALEGIWWRKRRWDPDPDALWANIYWVFLEVVCRSDPERRPDHLARKLLNDTLHRLHDEYRRQWTRAQREPAADPQALEDLAGGVEHPGFTAVELRDAQEAEIRRLRAHVDAGHLAEPDFFLLAGTRTYGRPLADFAREHGLDYQVVKKRRQRAEAALRRLERRS